MTLNNQRSVQLYQEILGSRLQLQDRRTKYNEPSQHVSRLHTASQQLLNNFTLPLNNTASQQSVHRTRQPSKFQEVPRLPIPAGVVQNAPEIKSTCRMTFLRLTCKHLRTGGSHLPNRMDDISDHCSSSQEIICILSGMWACLRRRRHKCEFERKVQRHRRAEQH